MCEPVTGESARGTWKKIGIVLQTEGEYPKDVYIEFWGDKADVVEVKLCEGMIVAVDFTLESREYNDRYYTQVRGYKYTIAVLMEDYLTQHKQALKDIQKDPALTAEKRVKLLSSLAFSLRTG